MRFEKIEFYARQIVDEDVLGNPIYDLVSIGSYAGKLTQWSTEEVALLDREVTRTQRKLLTDAPKNIIAQADSLKVEGVHYSIMDVKSDFTRWRLCHIKEHFI